MSISFLCFFSKVVLTILGSLQFHMNFRISLSVFFSFKSRYNWHTLYQFQVYNIALWSDHHSKSSEHPSPYIFTEFFFLVMRTFKIDSLSKLQICNTILTTVAMLYITSTWIISNWKFVHFDSLHSLHLPSTLASGNHQFRIYIYELVYVFLSMRVFLFVCSP